MEATAVALLGAVAALGVAYINNSSRQRQSASRIEDSLGPINGRGTVQMILAEIQDDIKVIKLHQMDVLRWQVDHVQNHLDRT